MASEQAYQAAYAGVGSRYSSDQVSSLVVAGNTTVKGPLTVPAGVWLKAIAIETVTAITGTPTSCLVSVGTTDGGVDIVAAVDCKGAAHLAATLVAAFDKVRALAAITTLYIQVVTSGGTSSAGTIDVIVTYCAPVH